MTATFPLKTDSYATHIDQELAESKKQRLISDISDDLFHIVCNASRWMEFYLTYSDVRSFAEALSGAFNAYVPEDCTDLCTFGTDPEELANNCFKQTLQETAVAELVQARSKRTSPCALVTYIDAIFISGDDVHDSYEHEIFGPYLRLVSLLAGRNDMEDDERMYYTRHAASINDGSDCVLNEPLNAFCDIADVVSH